MEQPLLERMEPRILLSADLPGLDPTSLDYDIDDTGAVLTPGDAEATRLVPMSLSFLGAGEGDTSGEAMPPPLEGLNPQQTLDPDTPEFLDAVAAPEHARQVLIIDASVADIDTLVRDFLDDSQAGIDQVFVLDPERDGIQQVADILGQFGELDAAHILSHAHNGQLFLGNATLSNANVSTYGESLVQWSRGLSAEADILLYGCNLAADADGITLVDSIATLTGADVAASEDLTGNAARGGDWDLEYQVGTIDSATFGLDLNPSWDGVLGSITVTFTGDVLDSNADTSSLAALLTDPGSDGQVSLREAIIAANNDEGTDTIYLGAGTFTLGISATDDDAALNGDLDITDDLVLRGTGSTSTTIDAAGIGRALHVHAPAVADIADLAIVNGDADNEGGSDDGGGIQVEQGSQLYLNNVLLQGNSAKDGGALWVKGYLQATGTSFYSNTATGDGGGLFVWDSALITTSTFSDNSADKGGAVFVRNSGLAEMTETTFSGNQAASDGGAIYNSGGTALNHVTVADNSAVSKGGGLYNDATIWEFIVVNSIVADNTAPTNPDVDGSFISDGDNLIRTPGSAFGFASDLTGVDPLLGGLTDNGGPTETHALLVGSPAIDAVGFTSSTVDQRGYGRPVGASADIGAFEFGAVPVANAPIASNDGFAVNEDTILSVNSANGVLTNDSDPNGDSLSAFVTDGPDNGLLVLTPTGLYGETNISANAGSDLDPVYSPDGSRIAFASNRSGALEIHLMDADGSNVMQLTSLGANSSWPSWSPDGSKLVFQTDIDGNNELYLINADGTGLTRLTNDVASDAQPAWSPDGTQIAFRSDRDGNNEIYVVNVDGSGLTRLTNDTGADRAPAWSPDGAKIAFTTDRDGDFNIYTMNADGSGLFQVTTSTADDRAPGYSPDGSKITFSAGAGGDYEISVINTDGTGLIALTANIDEDMTANWSPDGSTLIFRSDRDGNQEIHTSSLLFDGSFDYIPNANYNGVDSFSYVANDGALNSNPAITTITVNAVNDEQSLDTNTGTTVTEGSTTVISSAMLHTSDVDNTAAEIEYSVTALPANGTLELSGLALALNDTFTQDDIDSNRVSYDHDGSETSSDSFGFSVDDGAGNASTGTFNITIDPVNDNAPVADNESFSVLQGGTATHAALDVGTSLLHGDSDIDLPNDSLSINTTAVTGPSHGTLVLHADGTFSYTHDGSDNLSDSFTYEVIDGNGATDTATVSITVTLPPAPPPDPDPEPEEIITVAAPVMPEMVVTQVSETSEPDETDETEETEEPGEKEEKLLSDGLDDSTPSVAVIDEDPAEDVGVALELAATITTDSGSSNSAKFQIAGLPMFGSVQPVTFLSGDALAREIRNIMASEQFGQELDRLRDEINGPSLFYQNVIGTGAAATTTLSIGYVAWLLRGGVLLSTVLSSLPVWQFVDPLPILARTGNVDEDGEGDDSLEGIIQNGQGETSPSEADAEDSKTT